MKEWHIIALLGVTIIVYARVFLKEPAKSLPSDNVSKQIEETLELFAFEIEEENKQVLNHIIRMKRQFDDETSELKARMAQIEQQLMSHEKSADKPAPIAGHNMTQSIEHTDVHQENESIKERYNDIFALYEEGKLIEAISKKSGIPKGEIQLILKLAKQEEASRG